MRYVRPRTGIILAGIPRHGAMITDKLAKEWIGAGLVEEIDDPNRPKLTPKTLKAPAAPAKMEG